MARASRGRDSTPLWLRWWGLTRDAIRWSSILSPFQGFLLRVSLGLGGLRPRLFTLALSGPTRRHGIRLGYAHTFLGVGVENGRGRKLNITESLGRGRGG
jgi:hypothetical protein